MLGTLALAGVATAAAAVSHATFYRNSPVFGSVLGRLPTTDRVVALTFDDGPNAAATPTILEILKHENVPATFFMLGRHVDRWPSIARAVAADGHQVGNHGYHHRKLHVRGPAYARLDLLLGTDAIQRATDVTPAHFRAPHGFRNPWVSSTAAALGQRTVGWSLGVWDSDRPGANVIAERAVRGAKPGCILLLHDGDGYDADGDRMQTAEALPLIIAGLRDRGFRFVTLPT